MMLSWGNRAMLGVVLVFIIFLLSQSNLPQDLNYHRFADQREVFGIPFFWSVISNLPLAGVGLLGLYELGVRNRLVIEEDNRTAYTLLFGGAVLIALGSAYYHLAPDNQTLVWDRLPMAMVFMALVSILFSEYVSRDLGRLSRNFLVLVGMFSVIYWNYTENQGQGDLRFYMLVQALPILLTPIILLFFRPRLSHGRFYLYLWSVYLLAKVAEYLDADLYALTGQWLSGHTLKHLLAAGGLYLLLRCYRIRQFLPPTSRSTDL